MDRNEAGERAGRFETWLLLAALLFYAVALPLCGALWRPGYKAYDEESTLDQIQAWREGAPLDFRFARSSLHRAACALLVDAGGPHLFLLRLPALIAVLLEAILLFAWLRGKLGERAAVWAVLADLVASATFLRGGSLLGSSLLPALFLAHALALERLRRPWQAALWALSAGLCLLDYEGWLGALLFLIPYALWTWRFSPGLLRAAALGGVLGALSVALLSPDLLAIVHSRGTVSRGQAGFLSQVLPNLESLFSRDDRLIFAAAPFHPWPAPWIWLPCLLGLLPALRRFPWLAWLLACGSAALVLSFTGHEPQRLSLGMLALAACAGSGLAWLWSRRLGPALCVSLLVLGAADEARALIATPAPKLDLDHGISLNLEEAARWLALHPAPGGYEVISGLGPYDDGAFRFLLDQEGVPTRGRVPVALVYWDYLPGLASTCKACAYVDLGAWHPVRLFFPDPAWAARLRAVSASLAPLRPLARSQPPSAVSAAALTWLRAPASRDPWARTAAWELWLVSGELTHSLEPSAVLQMESEPLVSGWGPDKLAAGLRSPDPSLKGRFLKKAEDLDPRRRSLSLAQRIARY